ncbi:hypothetical protein FBUS_07258 [Fasciolopsis buskii]|uniref:Homeobox domain-containing protein n=1 Tax=Fasciolopsis buskii TaxID=27845 RepID=A0A8E0VHQ2_9TREM|nr:hypothetical protein FBUS_07258 [Fasciolopsis buski]
MNTVEYGERERCVAFSIEAILREPSKSNEMQKKLGILDVYQTDSAVDRKLFHSAELIRTPNSKLQDLLPRFQLTQNSFQFCTWFDTPITKSQNNVTFATTESTPSSGKLTSLHAMTSAARYRSARIPFTADQVQVMERKFYRSPYLSGSDVTGLAKELQLSETRVRSPFVRSFYVVDQLGFDYIKIWFQNRRARERRDAQQSARVKTVNHSTVWEEVSTFVNPRPSKCHFPTGHFQHLNNSCQVSIDLRSRKRLSPITNQFHSTRAQMNASPNQLQLLDLQPKPFFYSFNGQEALASQDCPFQIPQSVIDMYNPNGCSWA